ncbi:MAG: tetratricopeptide repeat protein [Clostridia bacterium]|nr:tetratricopeptide repeat protein [Clostridia bacterium]
MKKHNTKKEEYNFIDREEFRKNFPIKLNNYMEQREENSIADIIYYHGFGGMGKTTLVNRLFLENDMSRFVIKDFDFNSDGIRNPISFLIALRQSFDNEIKFSLFDCAYFEYLLKSKIEPDNRMKNSPKYIDFLKSAGDMGIAIAKKDRIDFFKAAFMLAKIIKQKKGIKKYKDEFLDIQNMSAKEIEKSLAKYLAKDIENGIENKKLKGKGIIVFLDTFEKVTSYDNDNIENELRYFILDDTKGLIKNTPRVLYVIASREKCNYGVLSTVNEESPLEKWDTKFAIEFIKSNSNITDDAFCEELANKCNSYPYYLDLAVRYIVNNFGVNYEEFDLKNFSFEIIHEKFFRGLNERYQNSIIVLSCQNEWEIQLYDYVTKEIVPSMPTVPLEEIKEYSFIKNSSSAKNKYTIHQLMRKYIDDNDFDKSDWKKRKVHSILKDIYKISEYDINTLVKESIGEKNILNQYVHHSIWEINNSSNKKTRTEKFQALFEELKKVLNQLKYSGMAKILLLPFEQLKDCADKIFGQNSQHSIDCLYQISFIYTYIGDLGRAEISDTKVHEAYKNAVEKKLKNFNISIEEFHELRKLEDKMVESYNSMNYDMCRNGKYPDAIKHGEKCLENAKTIWGESDKRTLTYKSNLGYFFLKNNKDKDAITIGEETLKGREELSTELQKSALLSKRSLAVMHKKTDLNRALELIKEAYTEYEKLFGEKDTATLEARQYYANFLIRNKTYDMALTHLETIKTIRLENDGENHPNMMDCYVNFALAYYGKYKEDQGKINYLTEAKKYINKAISCAEEVFNNENTRWKIIMYKKISNCIDEKYEVEEIISMWDNYKP